MPKARLERDLPYVSCISVELYFLVLGSRLAVPVASMAMLNGMCERAVTTYVLGSVWWSNKHVKSYSYPRARVHTDQGDLSRVKPIHLQAHPHQN